MRSPSSVSTPSGRGSLSQPKRRSSALAVDVRSLDSGIWFLPRGRTALPIQPARPAGVNLHREDIARTRATPVRLPKWAANTTGQLRMPAASHWLSADRAGLVCVLVGRPILGGSVPCAARACPNWASGWLRFPSLLGCLVTVRVDARVAPVLACAALLVALAAADVADRSQGAPILPPGSWRWAWIGGVVTSFAAYLWTIWLARKRGLSLRAVLVVAVAMQLAPLTGPLLLSSDVYSYWTYGRMTAVHGANPYSDLP